MAEPAPAGERSGQKSQWFAATHWMAERHHAEERSNARSPELAFDRRWAVTLLNRALPRHAVLRLSNVESGKREQVET